MDRLEQALVETEQQILEMERQYDHIIEAEVGSNADDEHDPEGQTLAFERQQLVALIEHAHHRREQIIRAIAAGSTDCEVCGRPIGEERLEARPYARTCVTCASKA